MTTVSFIRAIRQSKPPRTIEHYRNKRAKSATSNNFSIQYSPSDALRFSIMYHHPQYAQHLLDKYPRQCLSDTVCCPLILIAVQNNEYGILHYLCHYSMKHNLRSNDQPYVDARGCVALEEGKTALHMAAEMGKPEYCRLLLNYNADFHAFDSEGNTPLDRALGALIRILQYGPRSSSNTPRSKTQGIVQCIIDLMKCETKISSDKTLKLLDTARMVIEEIRTEIHDEEIENIIRIFPNNSNSPLSLLQLTRCSIRHRIGHKYKSDSIQHLQLPKLLQQYLELLY
ncbi:ankyrin repeat domain-containing protein 9-like [Tubulanus polymorphus]|uniref:ankyrin repeat domain-containing protein 9-like n=1 Tax=Tubulanus polymorphus TaxID=672921 RepID=UPI003DA3F5C6